MQKDTIKVLLIEDDGDDYILIRQLLEEISSARYELTWISNFDQGIAALRRCEHHVCLLDFHLGAHTGLDLLKILGTEIASLPPVIMLTGLVSREVDMDAMRYGASDYLAKTTLTELVLERAIRYSIQHRQALTSLRISETLNRSILSSLHDLIIVLDAESTVLSSNLDAPQFQKKPSCPLQDVQSGQSYLTVCEQEVASGNHVATEILAGLQNVMLGRRPTYTLEYACQGSARPIWFFISITPLVDGSGGAVIAFSDVSDRVWATEEVKRLNDELERAGPAAHPRVGRCQPTSHHSGSPEIQVCGRCLP